jgi:cob(I)alamin adenosyltransferase
MFIALILHSQFVYYIPFIQTLKRILQFEPLSLLGYNFSGIWGSYQEGGFLGNHMAKKRITKVYTRTGDKGQTSLVGGKRVSKSSARVEAYGDIDELNSVLGIVRLEAEDTEIKEIITDIQNDLFIIGADLASPNEIQVPRISKQKISELEKVIDKFLHELESLKEFILPSGSGGGPYLHLARTVSRRAERRIVRLMEEEQVNENILAYVNRLSDLLFVMARIENKRGNFEETYVRFDK